MKTFSLKKEDVKKKWLLIDAKDAVLGRLAVHSANILRGKNKPNYTPNQDCGDNLVIINSDHVHLKDEKHELRLPYWILFAAQCYEGWWNNKTFYIQNIDSQETLTKVRTQYNNWVNTQAGFVTKGEK